MYLCQVSLAMLGEPPFVVSGACSSRLYCSLLALIQYLVHFFPRPWYLEGGCWAIVVTCVLSLLGFKPARGVRMRDACIVEQF